MNPVSIPSEQAFTDGYALGFSQGFETAYFTLGFPALPNFAASPDTAPNPQSPSFSEPSPEEPFPEGTTLEAYAEGYAEAFAEAFPEGFADATEGTPPEPEAYGYDVQSMIDKTTEQQEESAADLAYGNGFDAGGSAGYSSGYASGQEVMLS